MSISDFPLGSFLVLLGIPLLLFIGMMIVIAIALTLILRNSDKETFLERKNKRQIYKKY